MHSRHLLFSILAALVTGTFGLIVLQTSESGWPLVIIGLGLITLSVFEFLLSRFSRKHKANQAIAAPEEVLVDGA